MILAIVFSILFILIISAILIFLLIILQPSLINQDIPFEKPFFSESEIRIKPSPVESYSYSNGKKAVVRCSYKREMKQRRFIYDGPKSCAMFKSLCDTEYDCKYGCIGFGDCANICSRNAITIINNTAVINELCNGCGKCLESCPNELIKLVSSSTENCVLCNAPVRERNSCTQLGKENSLYEDNKIIFHFWKKLYTMFVRR